MLCTNRSPPFFALQCVDVLFCMWLLVLPGVVVGVESCTLGITDNVSLMASFLLLAGYCDNAVTSFCICDSVSDTICGSVGKSVGEFVGDYGIMLFLYCPFASGKCSADSLFLVVSIAMCWRATNVWAWAIIVITVNQWIVICLKKLIFALITIIVITTNPCFSSHWNASIRKTAAGGNMDGQHLRWQQKKKD